MSASSALSFHCMICFEAFHHADRYPVVLPCGHTYVCNVCAERLDRCMECRTLLTWIVPQPTNTAVKPRSKSPQLRSSALSSVGRTMPHAHRGSPTPHVTPTEKKRLPLPKNVVLLSLMEATELASEMAHRVSKIDSLLEEDSDDQDEDEEEKIKLSTSLTIGACGTYVVADKDGLDIYPNGPFKSSNDEDMSSLLEEVRLKKVPADGTAASFELKYGDRVQIVSRDDGWAKLARGYGFVQGNARQLVKVGGSVDRACRLEAFLNALSARREELKAEQSKINSRYAVLMQNLQTALRNDEDLTIIPADTTAIDSDGEPIFLPQVNEEKKVAHSPRSESSEDSLRKPQALVRQPTPPTSSGFSCFGSDVFRVLSATVGGDDDDTLPVSPVIATPPAPIIAPPPEIAPPPVLLPDHLTVNESSSRESEQSVRSLPHPAQMIRERDRRQQVRGIDFRTGMSGHMGLVSYMVHPHLYLERNDSSRAPPRMSSHSGLTVSRRGDRVSSFKKSLPEGMDSMNTF